MCRLYVECRWEVRLSTKPEPTQWRVEITTYQNRFPPFCTTLLVLGLVPRLPDKIGRLSRGIIIDQEKRGSLATTFLFAKNLFPTVGVVRKYGSGATRGISRGPASERNGGKVKTWFREANRAAPFHRPFTPNNNGVGRPIPTADDCLPKHSLQDLHERLISKSGPVYPHPLEIYFVLKFGAYFSLGEEGGGQQWPPGTPTPGVPVNSSILSAPFGPRSFRKVRITPLLIRVRASYGSVIARR